MKWEYKTLTTRNPSNSNASISYFKHAPTFPLPESELNQLGDDEWQLVAVIPLTDVNGEADQVEYIFKRFK